MIGSYVFHVDSQDTLSAGRSYAFYSCLLSLVSSDYAEWLHEQGETPISQCLYRENAETLWKINLLDQSATDAFSPVLDNLRSLPLNSGEINLKLTEKSSFAVEDLIASARAIESDRSFSFRVLSPTAFKQRGRYTVFPGTDLILQSLLNKWNTVFQSYPLDDEEAVRMISEGLRLADYDLRTTRFSMKDNRIPGFIGTMRIEARLSAPLMEIWKTLIEFSQYSGIGIKTALGMGGIKLMTK